MAWHDMAKHMAWHGMAWHDFACAKSARKGMIVMIANLVPKKLQVCTSTRMPLHPSIGGEAGGERGGGGGGPSLLYFVNKEQQGKKGPAAYKSRARY